MKRGRPIKSQIRQNIVEILFVMGKGYAYEIYKIYIALFPKVTMRSIYYHLNKGKDLGEFEVAEIKKEKGDYSWGPEAEKIYYKLGPQASATLNEKVKAYLDKLKEKNKSKKKK